MRITADALGLLRRPLEAMLCSRSPVGAAGSANSATLSFIDPLRRLLRRVADEASLSLIGRMATRWDVVRFLTNLLRFHDAERRDPGILRQPIERPIFITGLPRSGTTFLHRLLLEDPDNRAPLRLADDLSVSRPRRAAGCRGRRAWRGSCAPSSGWLPSSARCIPSMPLAAGVQRDHRPCLPQPALRHDLSHPELPALAGRCRPRAGLPVSPALPPASAASGARRPLGGEVPRSSVRIGCDPRRISGCPAGVRASRSREGPAVGGQVDRGGAAAIHAAAGPARRSANRRAPGGWRVRSG